MQEVELLVHSFQTIDWVAVREEETKHECWFWRIVMCVKYGKGNEEDWGRVWKQAASQGRRNVVVVIVVVGGGVGDSVVVSVVQLK